MAKKATPVRKAPPAPSSAPALPRTAATAVAQAKGPAAVLGAIQAARQTPARQAAPVAPVAPRGLPARTAPVARQAPPVAQQAPKGPTAAELAAERSARMTAEKERDALRAQIASLTAATAEIRTLANVVDPEAQASVSALATDVADHAWIGCVVSFRLGGLDRDGKIAPDGSIGRGVVTLPHPGRDVGGKGRDAITAELAQEARNQGYLAIWPASQIVTPDDGPSHVTGAPIYYSPENFARVVLGSADGYEDPAYLSDVAPELLG